LKHERRIVFSLATKPVGGSYERAMSNKRDLEDFDLLHEDESKDPNELIISFTPLFVSMKMFGIYFNVGDNNSFVEVLSVPMEKSAGTIERKSHQKLRMLNNVGRIYSAVVLVLLCSNILRLATSFSVTDRLNAEQTGKIVPISFAILCATMHLSYFMACGSGRLNRVLRKIQVSEKMRESIRKKAIILTLVVWVLLVGNFLSSIFHFIDQFHFLITPIDHSWIQNSTYRYARKIGLSLVITFPFPSWLFPLATNHLISIILFEEFQLLNNQFHKSIDRDGLFRGDLRGLRRRHQKLSCIVKSADQFIGISNIAGVFCHVILAIFMLYSHLSYEYVDSVSSVVWLSTMVGTNVMMILTLCNGILVNNAVTYLRCCCLHFVYLD